MSLEDAQDEVSQKHGFKDFEELFIMAPAQLLWESIKESSEYYAQHRYTQGVKDTIESF